MKRRQLQDFESCYVEESPEPLGWHSYKFTREDFKCMNVAVDQPDTPCCLRGYPAPRLPKPLEFLARGYKERGHRGYIQCYVWVEDRTGEPGVYWYRYVNHQICCPEGSDCGEHFSDDDDYYVSSESEDL